MCVKTVVVMEHREMTAFRMAHLRIRGVDVAVFAANAQSNTDSGRAEVLANLTSRARAQGLRVDKSALAYGNRFYGTPDLVKYLVRNGVGRWTHTIAA